MRDINPKLRRYFNWSVFIKEQADEIVRLRTENENLRLEIKRLLTTEQEKQLCE